MEPFKQAYLEKCRQQDLTAWNTGRYVLEAIASCFGDHEYTDKPYSFKDNSANNKGLSDAEKFEMWAKKFNRDRTDEEG